MDKHLPESFSYFPGCSLATTAKENNQSLIDFCQKLDIKLIELDDWNCCGSSSAHSIDGELAFKLAARNLFRAPPDRPLLIACPSCLLRLEHVHLRLKKDPEIRKTMERLFDRPYNDQLEIIHFFELLNRADRNKKLSESGKRLTGLKFVPYYGCMLARPPEMRREKNYHGLMENVLSSLGAEPLLWAHASQCCGTFLSVTRPDIVTPIVNRIVQGAINAKAECIITACAMCHMNLEIRCNLKQQIPIMHFSEILSLALGTAAHKDWFKRHLVNPKPLLKSKGLI